MTVHIQIGDTRPRIQYDANGTQTAFPYPFPIFTESDLHVYLDATRVTTGFTVAGAGESEGGTVTFGSAPTDGIRVTLVRHLDIERVTDFQPGGPLRAMTLNDELDYLTAVDQQLDEALSRSVRVAMTAPDDTTLELPEPSPNAVLGWNETGDALVNDPLDFAALETELSQARAEMAETALGVQIALDAGTAAEAFANDAAVSALWADQGVEASTIAVDASFTAENWAEDAALSAWYAGQVVYRVDTAITAAGRAEGWADDAALSAWATARDVRAMSRVADRMADVEVLAGDAAFSAQQAGRARDRVEAGLIAAGDSLGVGLSDSPTQRLTADGVWSRLVVTGSDPYAVIGGPPADRVVGCVLTVAGRTSLGRVAYDVALFSVSTATVGASHAVSLDDGEYQVLTLTDDTVLTLPDPPTGQGYSLTLRLVQDTTGGRVPTIEDAAGTAATWLNDAAPVWATAAGAFDVVVVTHDGAVLMAAHVGGSG